MQISTRYPSPNSSLSPPPSVGDLRVPVRNAGGELRAARIWPEETEGVLGRGTATRISWSARSVSDASISRVSPIQTAFQSPLPSTHPPAGGPATVASLAEVASGTRCHAIRPVAATTKITVARLTQV